jgi:hypothetical protein
VPDAGPQARSVHRGPGRVVRARWKRRVGLRGCIGTIEAARPLYLDVIRNAQTRDARSRDAAGGRAEWPKPRREGGGADAWRPACRRPRAEEFQAALRPGSTAC